MGRKTKRNGEESTPEEKIEIQDSEFDLIICRLRFKSQESRVKSQDQAKICYFLALETKRASIF